ncbi:MliC family protein [Gelidibacter mesophilus]|uniref:MliC family protein n=1 Tax=Gelidibacter mesophilus TaxID=169050 RepID=UPI00042352EB|nr:MliC family protein [Gelidibacter mesophilus]
MTKHILTMGVLATLFLNSCKETPKQNNAERPTTETVADDIVKSTSTDKNGKTLDIIYNNTKGTATITYNGETIDLIQEKSASGIWYKNENYELRGKGNDIQLSKNGNVIFEHQDDIVNVESKSTSGDVLNMTFNNSEGTVKAYLNGGDQIDLVQKKAASGIWYHNDTYELRGKGDHYELSKDGKTVFEN